MVLSGRKITSSISSLTNRGCIFGSMAGLAPTTGLNPNLLNVYRANTNYCKNKCIPTGCSAGWEYMKMNGLIACNKSAGGIGRSQSMPGIGRLFGGGCQKGI